MDDFERIAFMHDFFQKNQDIYFTCKECGHILRPYINSNGDQIPIRRHAATTKKIFGRVLCLSCAEKIVRNEI